MMFSSLSGRWNTFIAVFRVHDDTHPCGFTGSEERIETFSLRGLAMIECITNQIGLNGFPSQPFGIRTHVVADIEITAITVS